jgi:hypothetical protein
MDNLTTTISFSIYSNKGVYALLLGAGISKTSGIPTSWDIVQDLIRKLAILKKEQCLPDPEKWFIKKYHQDPDYSSILSKLVTTSSERINLLKPYFEPSQEEREQGLKLPTKAHYSIANLVKSGYIKLIITTNFDRLIEQALQSVGIEPTVIHHSNDIKGIMPLVHNDFVLIKLNGDYLDSRFLNTKDELARYEKKMHDFILQIVNEFGIISCGWSAKWDIGLINLIKQSHSFRFGSFWTFKDTCENELKDIANLRKGNLIKIKDADSFFTEISEKIEALETINDNHPISSDIAVARLKKYILREENQISLHDLFFTEQETAIKKTTLIDDFTLYPDNEHVYPQLRKYESSLEIILLLIINGVYWSKPEQYRIFFNALLRFSDPPVYPNSKYYDDTRNLHYYPSLLILYSLGISAVLSQKYDLINTCFHLKIAQSEREPKEFNLIEIIHPHLVTLKIMDQILSTNNSTPLSNHIKKTIRPLFLQLIPRDSEFDDMFDVFEYLLALNYMDLRVESEGMDWAPYGLFKFNSYSGYRRKSFLINDFLKAAEDEESNWLPLKMGMLGSNFERFQKVKLRLDEFLKRIY